MSKPSEWIRSRSKEYAEQDNRNVGIIYLQAVIDMLDELYPELPMLPSEVKAKEEL